MKNWVAIKSAGMKKLGLICLFTLIATLSMTAQTNLIFGNLLSVDQIPRTNLTMTLTLISPKNRTYNGNPISNDPRTATTDTTGYFSFSNVIFGKYFLQPSDDSETTWILYVGTNTIGLWPFASLITNSAASPPNPATNYYTQSQMDALLASIKSGEATIADARTNLLWGTNLTVNAAARTLAIYYNFKNGQPIYGKFSTNFP